MRALYLAKIMGQIFLKILKIRNLYFQIKIRKLDHQINILVINQVSMLVREICKVITVKVIQK